MQCASCMPCIPAEECNACMSCIVSGSGAIARVLNGGTCHSNAFSHATRVCDAIVLAEKEGTTEAIGNYKPPLRLKILEALFFSSLQHSPRISVGVQSQNCWLLACSHDMSRIILMLRRDALSFDDISCRSTKYLGLECAW